MFLAHPYWLIALILLPLFAVGSVVMSRQQGKKWALLVAGRLRSTLIRRSSPLARWLSFTFLLAASALIIAAMSRPQGDGGTQAEKSIGRNFLLAIDLSRSMRVKDVAPDRLTLAKLVIFELLEAMPNDRIGLIGFAGEPYLYAPLTIDHAAVRETVEQMDESWPTLGGSDLGSAIRMGIETLKKTGQRNNAMVILTDGEMHQGDLDQMIAEAREAGVYIIAVGVGTADGAYVPHPDFPENPMLDRKNNPVLSRLQLDNLRQLALDTNGSFAVAGSGADIPSMVKAAIFGLEAFEIEGRERRLYIEFYQWLVMPAILLLIASLIAGTRWRALAPATAFALAALIVPTSHAEDEAQAQPSPQARQMEHYSRLADQAVLEGNRARYRLGEATAAYRLKQWDRASHAYSQALLSNNDEVLAAAHHGLGNTLFQKGWACFLSTPYTAELELAPSMRRFEQAARAKLDALKNSDPEADSDKIKEGYKSIEHSILNWSDSVRHYQSVLDLDSSHQGAIQNRELTLAYLRRLQELLDEDEKKSEEAMPEQLPEPGDGPGDQENPDSKNPGDQDSDQPGDEGSQGKDPKQSDKGDPNGEQGQKDPNGKNDPNQKPRDGRSDGKEADEFSDRKPGETPEEHARRRLLESSDCEKGPLTPGRILYREPEKDW